MGLLGLLWGTHVVSTPFPRLALTAHIQAMGNGTMLTALGLVLRQTDLLSLNPIQSAIVYYGLNATWAPTISEALNSYWGAKQVLPISAQQAGATGAAAWQEHIVTAAHLIPVLFIVPPFAVLSWELFFGTRPSGHAKK
ncbi:hypothetical protein M408DRAFT_332907 [Serendipita vermifera MAFF 305830]|uniref:Uncharacterized protein n=1 Tax=Serendipita vermifera MAFF 305830 TaxID=933852 RepID=A0A0C3A6Y2_SERVB|nr:hypothetical protein M408DRAFT_334002 [Serendipita vermifera MAFF 305830]KIM22445.1 hypothetical protein M408DRAFT_332907 [Serendipita vermifera MAFF 305830]